MTESKVISIRRQLPKNRFFDVVRTKLSVISEGRLHQQGSGSGFAVVDGKRIRLSDNGIDLDNFDSKYLSANSDFIDELVKGLSSERTGGAPERSRIFNFVINQIFPNFEGSRKLLDSLSIEVKKAPEPVEKQDGEQKEETVSILRPLANNKTFISGFIYRLASCKEDPSLSIGGNDYELVLSKRIEALETAYYTKIADWIIKRAERRAKEYGKSQVIITDIDKGEYGMKWINNCCWVYVKLPEHILVSRAGNYYRFSDALVGTRISGTGGDHSEPFIIHPGKYLHPFVNHDNHEMPFICLAHGVGFDDGHLSRGGSIAAYLKYVNATLLNSEMLWYTNSSWRQDDGHSGDIDNGKYDGFRITKEEALNAQKNGIAITNLVGYAKHKKSQE